jgi:hypothetical protein
MKLSYVAFTLLSTTLLLTGCGKKSIKGSELEVSPAIETIFVKGNPVELLAGSTLEKNSFITTTNIENFNDFTLNSIVQYTEKEEIVESNKTTAESGNEAPEESRVEEKNVNTYSFEREENELTYVGDKGLKFLFKEVNNKIGITGVVSGNSFYKLSPLHYSLKTSGEAFSILAETEASSSGKILLAFTFVRKSAEKDIGLTSTIYKYIFGAGVKVGWQQGNDLEINICGKQHYFVEFAYMNGIRDWNKALNKRLNIKTTILTTYPPFSDLNTKCIYTVRGYLTRTDKFVNMASTITKANLFEGKLLDSDIMVWVKENEKFGLPFELVSSLQQTTTHEVGHMLGLHHQFDKAITSIMSYDDNVTTVSDYDEKAIAELYPEIIKF